MPRKLKVFAWMGHRGAASDLNPNRNPQTREIMAAPSMAAISRQLDFSPRSVDMMETGNEVEIQVAMAEPGVIFWQPISEHRNTPESWRRDAKA